AQVAAQSGEDRETEGGEEEARQEEASPLAVKGTALLITAFAGACSSAPKPATVAPADAASKFRLAATLAAARRCDTAVVVARAAQSLDADNVRGPLVVGACQEQAGHYDEAIATYQAFAAQHPRARGVAALSARAELALRTSAEQTARQAPVREAAVAQRPPLAASGAGDGAVPTVARAREAGRVWTRGPARDRADRGRAAAHLEGRAAPPRRVPRVQSRARGHGCGRLQPRGAALRRGGARGPELP